MAKAQTVPAQTDPTPSTTALATVTTTYPMLAQEPKQIQALIEQNMGGSGLGEFDLDRIKMPAGGGLSFTIQGPDGKPQAASELVGIIIHWTAPRAFWEIPFDQSGGGSPPDCASSDGVVGVGRPGGPCAVCPKNAWGSDPKGGKGKACREGRRLFILMPGAFLPRVIPMPPTSIKSFKAYMRNLAGQGLFFHSVVTAVGLEKDKSKAAQVTNKETGVVTSRGGGIDYSKATFRQVSVLSEDEKKRSYQLALALTPAMQKVKVDAEDFSSDDGAASGQF